MISPIIFIIMLMEVNKAPFDLSEVESNTKLPKLHIGERDRDRSTKRKIRPCMHA